MGRNPPKPSNEASIYEILRVSLTFLLYPPPPPPPSLALMDVPECMYSARYMSSPFAGAKDGSKRQTREGAKKHPGESILMATVDEEEEKVVLQGDALTKRAVHIRAPSCRCRGVID